MEFTQEQIDALMDASAKIEAAEAEKSRLDAIGQKNAELDTKLAAVADKHSKTMKTLTDALLSAEAITAEERTEEEQAAFDEALAARKELIETIASECAEVEAQHLAENAAVYNA